MSYNMTDNRNLPVWFLGPVNKEIMVDPMLQHHIRQNEILTKKLRGARRRLHAWARMFGEMRVTVADSDGVRGTTAKAAMEREVERVWRGHGEQRRDRTER